MSQRAALEAEVAARAAHQSLEQVRTTCSFARAERLLGREYHGRFLIELLQNAADAWREDPRSTAGGARVRIELTAQPALLVANEGLPVAAATVVSSLGHIGASTKAHGEAIGHKGIGFKSVLEICDAPEVYSGLQSADPLTVGFEPAAAARMIRDASPGWEAHLEQVDNVDPHDLRSWVPVLRYPTWVDILPRHVAALAADGFDTVIRLPLVSTPGGTLDDTVAAVRQAIDDITDEIVLLLASFREVTFADESRASVTVVQPDRVDDTGAGEHVQMWRDDAVSSSWRLYRSSLDPDATGLSSELTVGLRVDDGHVHALGMDGGGAPFHLFFPTRIASGTPLLLHGYFEVDAARTGFYGGSDDRNRAILHALATLAATAIDDTLTQQPELAVSLATALAGPADPADPLAQSFRNAVFERLDEVAWVPAAPTAAAVRVRPGDAVALPALGPALHGVFPAAYVAQRLGRWLPDPALPTEVLHLVRARQSEQAPDELETVEELLLPGDLEVWTSEQAGEGFHALLDLLDSMRSLDRDATGDLLGRLRRDPDSRIVPTVSADGVALHACADPAGGRAGEASRVIMARVRRTTGLALSPPPAFDIDFLPDGLLQSEEDVDRAKDLGVRQFTVDSILDRLGTVEQGQDAEPVLTFLWRLLDREQVSSFGTRRCAESAGHFDPAEPFWCRPRRNLDRDTGAPRQRRERNLAAVHVPCRDGAWRPAGRVALGADWADWIEDHDVGIASDRRDRTASLRALEYLAPSAAHLLASPDELIRILDPAELRPAREDIDDVDDTTPISGELRVLAYLLRLGVWQVLPVEAWDDLSTQGRDRHPWPGATEELRAAAVDAMGGWTFESRPGRSHNNVWIGDDYRFQWSLETLATTDARRLSEALSLGLPLYRRLQQASAFCPQCRDGRGHHTTRHRSGPGDRFPSHLSIELHHQRWVPVVRDGDELPTPVAPSTCWWGPEPIGASVLRQNPERFLDRTDPTLGVTAALSEAAGLRTLATAPIERLSGLLDVLRTRYDQGLADELSSSGLARQAFIGLHRRIYRRLADLQAQHPDAVGAMLTSTGVLCERGNHLEFVAPGDARHDDGTHASHLRYFADDLPRVVLPRDATDEANSLGIPRLELTFTRKGDDDGADVTHEVVELIHDRIPELLAVLVHHSQGARTLEPTSQAFELRARRLQRLTVRQLDELVLHVSVEGTRLHEVVGEGSNDDLFLDGPTSVAPVLYHDLTGPDWPEQLRHRLAPHVAALVENAAYEHTFEAFFNRDGSTEREHFLLALGIRPEDVDHIADRIGAVSDDARRRQQRWYAAIASVFGRPMRPRTVDLDAIPELLATCGLAPDVTATLQEWGGGNDAREDPGTHGPMATLARCGVDLAELDATLREMKDEGLAPKVATARFRTWRSTHTWSLVAVLAPRSTLDEARATVHQLKAPERLRLELDPQLPDLLEPVVEALARGGIAVDARRLAADPRGELARAGGHASVDQLDAAVATYSDTDEWRRELRARAASWRDLLIDLAILVELPVDSTRAHVRELDAATRGRLVHGADRPSDLRPELEALFPEMPELVLDLHDELVDDVVGPRPTLDGIRPVAERHGVPVDRHGELVAARGASRRRVEGLQRRGAALRRAKVRPLVPVELQAAAPPPVNGSGVNKDGSGRQPIRRVKVDPSTDRRKRKAGDDGEQWGLAAQLATLTAVEPHQRERAIDEVVAFLHRHFDGEPVTELAEHGARARAVVDDEEEFLEHASRLLHVSAISDAFGFDVLGWLTTPGHSVSRPVCLEVKSTSGGTFHLSAGEWRRAEAFHDMELGDRYAVLAVVRSRSGGAPVRMDLLPDPVALVEADQLHRTVDGYSMRYRTR